MNEVMISDELMVERLASIEGVDTSTLLYWYGIAKLSVVSAVGFKKDEDGTTHTLNCAYLTDHNDIQRLVDGLDKYTGDDYHQELITIIIRDGGQYSCIDIHKATPRQKCEAILKVYGMWEVEG